MGKTIVAISGWVKSGKDTMANHILDTRTSKRIAFADALKENVNRDFDIPLADMHDQSKKELPLLDRPVEPKDGFSKLICQFMVKEFRTKDKRIAKEYAYNGDGQFYGVIDGELVKLYWTNRALCILEGSTKRTADSDYWVKIAVTKASDGLYVNSDLRYKSELAGIKMAMSPEDKLITVRVNRFDTTESTDPSERDLDDATFDYVIENRGTLEDYMLKIEDILKKEGI